MKARTDQARIFALVAVAVGALAWGVVGATPAAAGSSGGTGFAQRSRMSSGLLKPRGKSFSRSTSSSSKSTFLRDHASKSGSHFKKSTSSNASSKFLTEHRDGDAAFRTSTRANTTSSFSKARGSGGEAAFSGTTSQTPRAKFDPPNAGDPTFAKRSSGQPQSKFLDDQGRSDAAFATELSSKPTDGFPHALDDGRERAFSDKVITNGKSSFPESKARATSSSSATATTGTSGSAVRFSTGQGQTRSRTAATPAAPPRVRHYVFGRALVREGWARLGEGDRVDRLPDAAAGAIPIVSGGETYYRCDGIYLREVRDTAGNTRYVVTERIE